MLKKLKKNGNKGFTLVELIVVLVILAILAALLVPALTGYIDKARDKQVIAETRQAVMAAQTLADEKYALGDAGADIKFAASSTSGEILHSSVAQLAELTDTNIVGIKATTEALTGDENKGLYKVIIKELVYKNHGKYCKYTYEAATGGTYTTSKDALALTND